MADELIRTIPTELLDLCAELREAGDDLARKTAEVRHTEQKLVRQREALRDCQFRVAQLEERIAPYLAP